MLRFIFVGDGRVRKREGPLVYVVVYPTTLLSPPQILLTQSPRSANPPSLFQPPVSTPTRTRPTTLPSLVSQSHHTLGAQNASSITLLHLREILSCLNRAAKVCETQKFVVPGQYDSCQDSHQPAEKRLANPLRLNRCTQRYPLRADFLPRHHSILTKWGGADPFSCVQPSKPYKKIKTASSVKFYHQMPTFMEPQKATRRHKIKNIIKRFLSCQRTQHSRK